MIITRTPVRISLGGGGTDLPSYSDRFGGMVISAAINRYMFISINKSFGDDYLLKYSQLERAKSIADIEHPIIREALRRYYLAPGIEVVSVADIPSGTGLGTSGSFTVGLLRALSALRRDFATAHSIAIEACDIEIGTLGRPVGKQDQFIASYGGVAVMEFRPDGSVEVNPLRMTSETLAQLESNLVMFFTGYSRDADLILGEQKAKSEDNDPAMIENLHTMKELGLEVKVALESGDVDGFGEIMNRHWLHKKERSASMTNPLIDRYYELALAHGAIGGKLVGAGAGGFLLFYTRRHAELREAMATEGLQEVPFGFDFEGTTVLVRD
jgi:D-glycero-alpha-D-manno-heptose-7-phosphate kinase